LPWRASVTEILKTHYVYISQDVYISQAYFVCTILTAEAPIVFCYEI
jgi:hypothetical protein